MNVELCVTAIWNGVINYHYYSNSVSLHSLVSSDSSGNVRDVFLNDNVNFRYSRYILQQIFVL